MVCLDYESDCYSESDESSYLSEMEDEQHSASDSESLPAEAEGPYSDEPIADEQWLEEYNQERERIEEHTRGLQNRLDGVVAIGMWCRCGNCRVDRLQNAEECQCCHELERCKESLESELVIQEVEMPPICITLHPGFNAVCLNRWSLRSSAAKYKTMDGSKYRQTGSEDQFLRATAYREFTQLVHGYLGQKRISLPACAYNIIRKELSGDNNFTGYEDNN